jgi:hypothetical protein
VIGFTNMSEVQNLTPNDEGDFLNDFLFISLIDSGNRCPAATEIKR